MLLHKLRETEQHHSCSRPPDIHGTASPPRILAIDGPAASSSTGKCEDDEDGGGIPPSSSWARTNLEGMGRMRLAVGFRHLILGGNKLAGGARHPPASHLGLGLVLLFATPLTLASGVVFSVADVDVDVVAFAFQLAGVDVVAVMFAGASVTGSVKCNVSLAVAPAILRVCGQGITLAPPGFLMTLSC